MSLSYSSKNNWGREDKDRRDTNKMATRKYRQEWSWYKRMKKGTERSSKLGQRKINLEYYVTQIRTQFDIERYEKTLR